VSIHLIAPRAPRDVEPTAVAPTITLTPSAKQAISGRAVSYSERFGLRTGGVAPSFLDLTDLTKDVIARSDVQQGSVLVCTAHTTCAVIVQENEPLLLADLADRLRRFASEEEAYRHNEMDIRVVNVCGPDECANGHSHCQHALLGASVTLPVHDGEPVLGRWQRILLVELDHPRSREFLVQVTGVSSR
jgi:secondary thiamine-phosphate synthase enzyme